jgi:glucoamylase
MGEPRYATIQTALPQSDLFVISRYLLPLMLRNVASDGYRFVDPRDLDPATAHHPPRFSEPGCIIASPSTGENLPSIRQDYVYNWTRDAAVTAIEIAGARLPAEPGQAVEPLCDYVSFAKRCQDSTPGQDYGHGVFTDDFSRGAFTIEGELRDRWSNQNDGPALQTLAILTAFDQLDGGSQQTARTVVERDLAFLLMNYQKSSTNLWEEHSGQSFFTRSVQLRCLREVRARSGTVGIAVPAGVDAAIGWLEQQLDRHWSDADGYYVSVLDPTPAGYDPNIDVVMASVYGAVDCTDPRLLATATKVRAQWSDPNSAIAYPINAVDAQHGMGPMLGRYPGDVYDGDNNDSGTSHPWALCTANFAELYYRVAAALAARGQLPVDDDSVAFLRQAGIDQQADVADVVQRLQDAGDAMLHAVVFHSDHLELSEQFDGVTGYEKSVANLTWSYAAFLSAVRARQTLGCAQTLQPADVLGAAPAAAPAQRRCPSRG